MLKLKLQYFGHLLGRTSSLEKILMLGNIQGRRRRGGTENEMVGLYHHLNGHKFEQIPGDTGGHGSLACCSPWDHKESDMTELLNNNSTFKLTFCLTWILQWLLKHSAHIHAGLLPICSPLHISGKVWGMQIWSVLHPIKKFYWLPIALKITWPGGFHIMQAQDIKKTLLLISESISCSFVSDFCDPMECSLPGSSVHGIL